MLKEIVDSIRVNSGFNVAKIHDGSVMKIKKLTKIVILNLIALESALWIGKGASSGWWVCIDDVDAGACKGPVGCYCEVQACCVQWSYDGGNCWSCVEYNYNKVPHCLINNFDSWMWEHTGARASGTWGWRISRCRS